MRASREISAEAHQLTLRARHISRQFNREALERAAELLRQALDIEPDYVDALNVLAAVFWTQVGEGFAPMETIDEARSTLEKALTIDPDDADAHSGLGWLALRFDSDLETAARHLQPTLASGADSVDVLNTVGGLLLRLRRVDEAITVARRIVQLDPLNAHAFANLGVYSLFAGDYETAIDAYQTVLELSPGFIGAHFAIGTARLLSGDPEAALAAIAREGDEEFRTKGKAFVYWTQGDTAAFQRELDSLIEQWGAMWPSEVAEVYAYAGMTDEAFTWINKDDSVATGSGWAESVLNPAYKNLHSDPRWGVFLESTGLAPEQLAEIEFELPLRFKRGGRET